MVKQIDIKPDGTPIVTGGSSVGDGAGIPLLTLIAVPFEFPLPGFLSVTKDNGTLSADVFPDAYSQLVTFQQAGERNIVSFARYQDEFDTNGGICGGFALDTTSRTFRLPCMPGTYWAGVMQGQDVGQFLPDQMRSITGTFGNLVGGSSTTYNQGTGLVRRVDRRAGGPVPSNDTNTAYNDYEVNSALLGPHYSGERTRPQSITMDYQMRMYNTPVDIEDLEVSYVIAYIMGALPESVFNARGGYGAAFPSNEYVSLNVPTSGSSTLSPGDGWMAFYADSSATDALIYVYNNDSGAIGNGATSSVAGRRVFGSIPIRKGNNISVQYMGVTNLRLHFVPSIGTTTLG